VVTSLLGPGMIRGDRHRWSGLVGANAHLILTAQSATRLLGDRVASHFDADWTVEPNGFLELIGEPLVPLGAVRHISTLRMRLAPASKCLVLDCITAGDRQFERLTIGTIVGCGEKLLVHDLLTLEPEALAGFGAVGTLLLCGDRWEAREQQDLNANLDAAASHESRDVRIGIGCPRFGGAAVRVTGHSAWEVRAVLHRLRSAALRSMGIASAQESSRLPLLTS